MSHANKVCNAQLCSLLIGFSLNPGLPLSFHNVKSTSVAPQTSGPQDTSTQTKVTTSPLLPSSLSTGGKEPPRNVNKDVLISVGCALFTIFALFICIVRRHYFKRMAQRLIDSKKITTRSVYVSSWHSRTITTGLSPEFFPDTSANEKLEDSSSARSDVAIYPDQSTTGSVVLVTEPIRIENPAKREADMSPEPLFLHAPVANQRISRDEDWDGNEETGGETSDIERGETMDLAMVTELRRLRRQVTRLQIRVTELEEHEDAENEGVDTGLPSYEQVQSIRG